MGKLEKNCFTVQRVWATICSTASADNAHADPHRGETVQLSPLRTEVPAFVLEKQSQVRDTRWHGRHQVDRTTGTSRSSSFAWSRLSELNIFRTLLKLNSFITH